MYKEQKGQSTEKTQHCEIFFNKFDAKLKRKRENSYKRKAKL